MVEETSDAPNRLARSNQETLLVALAVIIVILSAAFLYSIGQYALVGRHPFQFFADSSTYHDLYSGYIASPDDLIGVSYNFLGPMVILNVAGGNIYVVMFINVVIFVASIIYICRKLGLNPIKAAFVQFLSPMTSLSLLSVNKEILVFPVIALLIGSYKSRSVLLLVIAIFIATLARWQLAVFCIALAGLYVVWNANRYVTLGLLLLVTSVAYYFSQEILEPVLRNVELSTSQYTEGSGIFERLIDLQNAGLYFFVAFFKAGHLLFSLGFRIDGILNPIVVYNDQVVATYCLVNLVMFSMLMIRRDLKLSNDLIMISAVYLIIFALTPVYAPRYFYAVTVLWGLTLAGAKGAIPVGRGAQVRAPQFG